MHAAGNDEPIPFNGVGDAGRIGRDRAQVAEGFPSLRLAQADLRGAASRVLATSPAEAVAGSVQSSPQP